MINKDVVIIGGGAAGLACACSLYENNVKDILLIEREDCLGGILNQCIHNGFGLANFKEELTGPEYSYRYIKKINDLKIPYLLNTEVINITSDKVVSYINADGFTIVKAKCIVLATGSYERSAGSINLPGDRVSGILTAGTVQKMININGFLSGKKVVILGSGDIGLIMARRLTLEGAKVICVAEIMPYSNGLNRNIVQCLNDFNIPLFLSTTVTNVIGKNRVEKVVLSKVDENRMPIKGSEKEIECDSLILSCGLMPQINLVKNMKVRYGKNKSLLVDQNLQSDIAGLFSCGNALHIHDLVDYVSQEGEIVAKSVADYLFKDKKTKSLITVDIGNDIGYVVPGVIDLNSDAPIHFKFRVRRPLKNIRVCVMKNNEVVKSIKCLVALPSVMNEISVSPSDLVGAVTIKLGVIYE